VIGREDKFGAINQNNVISSHSLFLKKIEEHVGRFFL